MCGVSVCNPVTYGLKYGKRGRRVEEERVRERERERERKRTNLIDGVLECLGTVVNGDALGPEDVHSKHVE